MSCPVAHVFTSISPMRLMGNAIKTGGELQLTVCDVDTSDPDIPEVCMAVYPSVDFEFEMHRLRVVTSVVRDVLSDGTMYTSQTLFTHTQPITESGVIHRIKVAQSRRPSHRIQVEEGQPMHKENTENIRDWLDMRMIVDGLPGWMSSGPRVMFPW